ncbi:hypothetical protein ACOMHN_030851 [Nucella lapillus]
MSIRKWTPMKTALSDSFAHTPPPSPKSSPPSPTSSTPSPTSSTSSWREHLKRHPSQRANRAHVFNFTPVL